MKFAKLISAFMLAIGLFAMVVLPDQSQSLETNENLIDGGTLLVILSLSLLGLFYFSKKLKFKP